MKFKKKNLVRYLSFEVSQIIEIKVIDLMGKCYCLRPIFDERITKYIPIDIAEENGMRAVLSADEIADCFRLARPKECPWIDNEAERRKLFRDVINSCDFRKTYALLKSIQKKRHSLDPNKSLKTQDEALFKEAHKLVAGEIAVAYNFESIEQGIQLLDEKLKPRAKKS